MNKIVFFITVAFQCLIGIKSYPQAVYTNTFELCNNRILIKYPFNKKIVTVCFDTGADQNFIVNDKSLLDNVTLSSKVRSISLGLSDLKARDITNIKDSIFGNIWMAFDNNNYVNPECFVEGIVDGSTVLDKYIVELNFLSKIISFHSSKVDTSNSNFHSFTIKSPTSGYETSVSFSVAYFTSISGTIHMQDSSKINTQFLIDTGSRFEIILVVSDSLLIKKYSKGKDLYVNDVIGTKKSIDFTYVNYSIENTIQSQPVKAFMFYREPNIFSEFGSRKIGVLLGIPFFRKYKSMAIDNINKKLYLFN